MIVKVKTYKRPNYKKLLEYITNDKDRLVDKEGNTFMLTHNLKGRNIESWEKQFKKNETYRKHKRKDSVILTHEILSWHKEDAKHISIEKMEAMAREYIQRRNPKGIYVIAPHFDKNHYHIHICASGLEYHTGKAMRMSKGEFRKLKKDIQEYQQKHYPELSKSVVEHWKKEKAVTSDKEYQFKLRTGRQSEKEQVIGMLKTCYKASNSIEDFYNKLKECGIETYNRSGKTTGIIFGKHKFRFNRLGYTEERIQDLNKTKTRANELNRVREKMNNRNIQRSR